MTVTEKGQVTIPKEIRVALGIGAGTEVEFERHEDARWGQWSADALVDAAEAGPLSINPVVCSEVSIRFTTVEEEGRSSLGEARQGRGSRRGRNR